MGMRVWGGVVAIACLAVPAVAADVGKQAAIERALARGKSIYAYDQAAWVTTDAMIAAIPEARKSEVRGWVVAPAAKGRLAVTYYGLTGSKPYAVFTADTNGRSVDNKRVWTAGEARDLTPELAAQIRVREQMTRLTLRSCTPGPLNSVILPPETSGGPYIGYLLSGATDPAGYPAGGHYRIEVSQAGEVVAQRPFTKSCIALGGRGPDGARPAALVVSHILDPVPTEIHVFVSLATKLPLYVVTGPDATWKVTGTAIERVKMPG
ncbi:hypothetical protein FHS99_000005 [Sphingomonas prati]|uniref:DUF3108 domain-containing protein n=2 Tax=Sphingomonas prati TaxID=1843237 RepID=A0A7W9F199_9SPHN|nr:hypothetical protein [Sphingomonas prati]MBB5727549.1 hypothetical protein [Sphingomonas prati]